MLSSALTLDRSKEHTYKEQGKDDDELEHGVSEDVLHHGSGNERIVPTVGLSQQQGFGGRLCRKSQGSKRVHDEIDP